MPVLTVTEMTDLILDRLQANVAVDPAFTAAEILRYLNDAYTDVWEISGGAMKRVAGGTLWDPQPSATANGTFTAKLTDVGEVKELFHSTIFESTGDIVAGDKPLSPTDLSEVMFMRSVQSMFGAYSTPKIYALTRNFATAPAEVNKLQLDVWPGAIAGYLPTHYIPQFTPLDGSSVTVPALNDLESRDLWLLAAARMAPRTGRAEFVPDILADVSRRTAEVLERKLSSLMSAKSDQ